MIASLPMYDRAETHAAQQDLWVAVRDRLGPGLPPRLIVPDDPMTHWLAPDLALSQTCGFPYRTRLHGRVALIGTPDYGLPDCPPGYYRSILIQRTDDRRDDPAVWASLRWAVNATDSQSGWAAPVTHLAERGLRMGPILLTGGHRASAAAVAEGRADIAALDAQTWRMMRRWDDTRGLREVAHTTPTPGLPFIAARGTDAAALRQALADAIASLTPADRTALDLIGLTAIPAADYLAVPIPAADLTDQRRQDAPGRFP